MNLTNLDIIGQLERLAEACPWDQAEIWICRTPEGRYEFTAHIPENPKFGFPYLFCTKETPREAVDEAIKQTGSRDPELMRKRKIEELRQQIEKLQAVVIGLPPYRPGRELGNGEPTIKIQETVDV